MFHKKKNDKKMRIKSRKEATKRIYIFDNFVDITTNKKIFLNNKNKPSVKN